MASEVGSAYVTLIPSAKGFASKMQKELAGDVARAGRSAGDDYGDSFSREASGSISGKGKSMFSGVAKLAAGALAGIGIGQFIGGAIGEARDAVVIGARTSNVIKSMGNAANISADQVGKLAEKLSNKAAMDDEAIQSGANLLLTFGNVRNEAGKGNDIFSQTTGLMVDMSAAMGTDMKGAALQLGKALNDPTKGVTALARSGVSFTEQQKEQIKTLQASGDMMGAQKVILSEVEKQFGGAAKSMATPADRAKVAWGNFQESVGTVILPVVDKLLTKLAEFLPQAGELASTMSARLGPALSTAATSARQVFGFLSDNIGTVKAVAGAIAALVVVVQAHALALAISSGALKAWALQTTIVSAVTKAYAAVQWLLNAAMSANPLGLLLIGLVALGVAIAIAWRKSETFRSVVTGAFNGVKAAASKVFDWLSGAVGKVIDFVRNNWQKLVAILGGPLGVAFLLVKNHWDDIKRITEAVWNAIKGAVSSAVNAVLGFVGGIASSVAGFVTSAWEGAKNITSRLWEGIKNAVTSGISGVVNGVKTIKAKVLGALSGAGTWLTGIGKNIVEGLGAGIESMYQWVRDKVDALSGWIPGWVKKKLGIASPSKVMKKLGGWIGAGLAEGIAGSTDQVTAGLDALSKGINARLDRMFDGKKLKAKTKVITKAISDQYAALRQHGKAQDILTEKLETAKDSLATLVEASAQYAQGIKDTMVSFGNLIGLGAREIVDGEATITQITSGTIIEDLQKRAAEAAAFTETIAQLRGMGLNSTTLEQLYQAGPEAALATAQALSAGGAVAVAEVNALTSQIAASATTLGDSAAIHMHGAGVQAAQAIVNGFVADQETLDAQAQTLVAQLVAAIDKATEEVGIDLDMAVGKHPEPKKKKKKGKGTKLASGGRVTGATVALIGEGREPETVLPDSLLRGLLERTAASAAAGGGGISEVRVFIGERELTDLVRVEVNGAQVTQARQLAYGRRA